MTQHRSYLRLQRVNPQASAEYDRLFAHDLGGRGMAAYDGGQGEPYPLAPHPAFVRRRSWVAVAGSATPLTDGFGSNTTGSVGTRAIAANTMLAAMPRLGFTAGALSGSAGVRHGTAQFFRNTDNAGLGGGFFMATRLAIIPTTTSFRFWVGMTATIASLGTTQPSAVLNGIGFGADSNDTDIRLMCNGASGAADEVSTGVSVASIASVPIDLVVHVARLNTMIGFAWRAVGGNWVSYAANFAKAPANQVLLAPQVHLNAGTILAGSSVEVSSIVVETDI